MLTIGVTAYREGEWLQQCWDSVLNQNDRNWRAVMVLDGGADVRTRGIFNAIEHPQLRKFAMPANVGPYHCREVIFHESEDDVVLYIDADDFFDSQAVAKVSEIFADQNVAYAAVGAKLLWENGETTTITGHPVTIERLIRYGEFPGYLLFRKSIWTALGCYDSKLKRGKADLDLMLRILERKLHGGFVDEVLVYKRERAGSVSRSYLHRMGSVHERIVQNHPEVFRSDSLRKHFLDLGYKTSAWACFEKKMMKRSALFSHRGMRVGARKDYWPLHLAATFPESLLKMLIVARRSAAAIYRTRKIFRHERLAG